MKRIPVAKIKKDNTNIRYYSDSLWRALRKERFKPLKQEQYERFFNYCLAAKQVAVDPYESMDFQMDMEKFKSSLSSREAECLEYFLGNLKQEDIASVMGVSQTLVSFILSTVFLKFSAFYCENIEEEVGIEQFKCHLKKSERMIFELYLEGVSVKDTAEALELSRTVVNNKLNAVFSKFHAFFGVRLDG